MVAALGRGECERGPYLVMELVRGETLRRRLEREGRLPTAEALVLGQQVASALAYAHERRVVHRDVKPDNVVIAGDGTAKLVHFGIARSLEGAPSDLTRDSAILGTLAYMAPEQLQLPTGDRPRRLR